ncbi:MAG: PD-(D/E)XK nuclease family protein [Anaerolineae bacterium]|nr:PD-(D/E)XK nuclease family protein [Anaerolineae bacterium]
MTMQLPFPDMPPDAVILTGPVGSGKTHAALDAILEAREFAAFSTIWVLLATGQQSHMFRQRLLDVSPDAVQFGVEFFDFYGLYDRLLALAGDPQRQVADTARYQILRHITGGLRDRGELELFGPIAHMPGFIGLLAGLIHELKQGLVQPEDFARVAAERGPKDRDLARLYAAYQQFLQDRRLVDRHGAGWLAVEYLKHNPKLAAHVDLLVVDGFDQFNGVHIALLTQLAQQVRQSVLTLVQAGEPDAGEPGEIGRRFRRFDQTLDRLLHAENSPWRVEELSPINESTRPPVLDHLVRTVFVSRPDALPGDDSLNLVEAPDTGREVRAVLRRVKRLLLDGVNPESVAVLARRIQPYGGALREIAQAYGVPLVVREGVRLRDNPAVAALLTLIDLHALDFPRRDVLDTLCSPYVCSPDLAPEHIAWLARISLEQQVVHRRDIWLDAVIRTGHLRQDEDGELSGQLALHQADARTLAESLRRHFDRITPPPGGTAGEFTHWIEGLIGPDPAAGAFAAAEGDESAAPESGGPGGPDHFNVLNCARTGADPDRKARDIEAIDMLLRVLNGVRLAHDLLDGAAALVWADFRAELELAVERTTLTPPGGLSRLGRVLATDVLEARGLPHDHVFVLGMAEGVFPQPESEDALYQEHERLALEAAQIDMVTATERADELSLFYQVLGLARQTLTLSRPTIDDKGMPLPPSPYWDAVRAAVTVPDTRIERVPVGAAPSLDQAATFDEAAVALAAGEFASDGIPAEGVHNALLAHPAWGARWLNARRGWAIESLREDPARPFDRFSGLLTQPDLIADAARRLSPARVWSASQLNEYGICPFRFFARRLLRLEEFQEPEEGLDVLQVGSINHAILERTYNRFAAENLDITPEHADRALVILDEEAAQEFQDAPRRYNFRESAIWDYEQADMQRRLRWLVQLDFSDTSPFLLHGRQRPEAHPVAAQIGGLVRRPFRQEAAFGIGDRPPLVIDGPAGPVRVRGLIDRLDIAGDQVVVIDYKTGTAPHPVSDMAAGRDFQMMVYVLAACDLLEQIDPALRVAGGLFWHISSGAVSGEIAANDPAVDEARDRLHRFVIAAREGYFAVQPRKLTGGRCVHYCEFGALCRMSRGYLRKPSPAGAEL